MTKWLTFTPNCYKICMYSLVEMYVLHISLLSEAGFWHFHLPPLEVIFIVIMLLFEVTILNTKMHYHIGLNFRGGGG